MSDREELKQKVMNALAQLYGNDRHLLASRSHEGSITHKLAEYIGSQFTEWDVDCEYTRDGMHIKRSSSGPIRPDIIVHQRGSTRNLLAVEAKTAWARQDERKDQAKLRALTGDSYEYEAGVFLLLDMEEIQWLWFANGEEVGTFQKMRCAEQT